jgi:hypothetical protein
MLHRILILVAFLFGGLAATTLAQQTPKQAYAQYGLDGYTAPANAWYWKNRPHENGYWQQDVAYKIKARLDDSTDCITGSLTVQYKNNSPDTLYEVFMHLYQNAFVPGSYLHALQLAQGDVVVHGKNEKDGNAQRVDAITQNGQALKTEQDNTILRVVPLKPIAPGEVVEFAVSFRSFFAEGGTQRRRMKMFKVPELQPDGKVKLVKHYDLVHWYPRIGVYDPRHRWNTDQHLGREFYGDFGSYEVELTLPAQYIADGTGVLANESEVLPSELRKKLDIKNFADKKIGSPASQIIAPNGTTKTWRFQAVNTHDCAFTFDPTYRIGEANWEGIRCISIAQESNAAGWQDAAEFAAKVIAVYSTDFGRYAYPKMIVADARDGMEYPMLTLDGDLSPDYKGLLAHEIGHNWFYGMIGSNETYRAFLDEGFTQFLTAWAMDKIEEKPAPNTMGRERWSSVYRPYLNITKLGYDQELNTHSDHIDGQWNYGQVYFKTATMLYNLQYVLGDKLFARAMQGYFDRWKIRHPYPEDFRRSITDVAKTDLSWFFDQWLEKKGMIDYGIANVRKRSDSIRVTLRRNDNYVSPIDFIVTTKKGDTLSYTIPNTWFHKNEPNVTVLPKWTGWDNLKPEYRVTLPIAKKDFKTLVLDPSLRMADADRLDNLWGAGQVDFSYGPKPNRPVKWTKYQMGVRANLWWNGQSGVLPGVTLSGSYFKEWHKFRASFWIATTAGQINHIDASYRQYKNQPQWFHYLLEYSTPLSRRHPQFGFYYKTQWQDGLFLDQLGFTWYKAKATAYSPYRTEISLYFLHFYRPDRASAAFLNEPDQWTIGKHNATVNISLRQAYRFGRDSRGEMSLLIRTGAIMGDNLYSTITFQTNDNYKLYRKLRLRLRTFWQYGDGPIPIESALFLAGGNPQAQYGDDIFRSRGWIPPQLLNNNNGRNPYNAHYGGGLNLRGYTGYRAEFGDASSAWYGSSGWAINTEIGLDQFLPNKWGKVKKWIDFDLYLFVDVGQLGQAIVRNGMDGVRLDKLRADAGPGFTFTFKGYDLGLGQRPYTLRVDFPVFLSAPPAGQQFLQFRWQLGVARAF